MSENISPEKAFEWLKNGEAILIDVREADEFNSGHIAYAVSLPLSSFGTVLKDFHVPENSKIIVQCLRGSRGAQACVTFDNDNRFGNKVYNIDGGIDAWKDAGLPVVGAVKQRGMSIFRQVQTVIGALIMLMVALGFAGITIGFILAGLFGGGLLLAGLTGWCGLAMLMSKMPWNK